MKRKYTAIKTITPEQRLWLDHFEGSTMLDPIDLDELMDGSMTFDEVAKANIIWFADFANDAQHQIERDVPYNDDDLRECCATYLRSI